MLDPKEGVIVQRLGALDNLIRITTGAVNVVLAYRTQDENMDRDEFTITVDYGAAQLIATAETLEEAANEVYKIARHV